MKAAIRMSERLKVLSKTPTKVQTRQRGTFAFRVAGTAKQRFEAACLVGRMYQAEGYLKEDRATRPPAFFGLHHLLDECVTFIAEEDNRITGTLTVILDSPAGLPLEGLYPEEVAALRRQEHRVCEFCSLAVEPKRREHRSIVLGLFKKAFAYVHHLAGVTDVCVTLKPSHERFYRRLRFEDLGGFRRDHRFDGAETIALRLPTETARRFWASGEALSPKHHLAAFLSKAPTEADKDRLLVEVSLRIRTPKEKLEWLKLRPDILSEASAGQRRYVLDTVGRKLAILASGSDRAAS